MASYSWIFLVAILACACRHSALAARYLTNQSMAERHEQWMARYGRMYSNASERSRWIDMFRENLALIESVNGGNHKFWIEANQFADLTNDEFRSTRTRYRMADAAYKHMTMGFRYENVSLDALPTSVDWRTKGVVTPIKDQGQCACWWAFSTVASMEGIVKLSTGKLVSLSEEELVDCNMDGMDQACEGRLMDNAFEFIIDSGDLHCYKNDF